MKAKAVRRWLAIALSLLLATSLVQLRGQVAADAYPNATVDLVGHGWGHGRGLSQYGALGYAVNYGWSWQQILDRYYGNTSMNSAGNPEMTVRMVEADGADMIVYGATSFNVAGIGFGANSAALVRRVGANAFTVFRSGSCGGAGGWASASGTIAGPVTAAMSAPGDPLANEIQLCTSAGPRGVLGTLSAKEANGTIWTVNTLDTESYLRGVVPRESPASWGDLGGGAGLNALRAQAVAARSYAIAENRYAGIAKTCDTTSCQVYGGAFLNGQRITDARSDAAIASTAGMVRRNGNGSVAYTEFSSSSGGFTAGGSFPAVSDDGDAVAQNPNHTWTVSLSPASVQAAYPSIGTLTSININGRNGLGDQGGRVTSMTIIGSSGSVTTSGDGFASKMGLKSNWFQIANVPSGGVNGYWQLGNDGGIFTFGSAQYYGSTGGVRLNSPVVNMAPTASRRGYWLAAADGGVFTYGDAPFYGSLGGIHLNQPIVAMVPTPTSRGYWLIARDGGVFTFGDAQFYGSTGGIRLNKPIVGAGTISGGNGYYLVASDGGVFTFGGASFLGSLGGVALRAPIVQIVPSRFGYWLIAADGGVFTYGDAAYLGSLPGSHVNAEVTGMTPTRTGGGYMLTTADGQVFSFGDAPTMGSLRSLLPAYRGRVLSMSSYW